MARGIVDIEGLNQPDVVALRNTLTPKGLPFSINKIGHVVLKVQNIEKSAKFFILRSSVS